MNFIQPGKFHTSKGFPAPMFDESVYHVKMKENTLFFLVLNFPFPEYMLQWSLIGQ